MWRAEDYFMIWASLAVCYIVAATAFYSLAAKTAQAEVELVVVEGQSDSHSRAA